MSRANIGIYGEELYEQVLSLHGPDPDGLLHDLIGAYVHGALEIDDLARDDAQGRPGWGVILDVDECPVKGLWWLAQLAGVRLRQKKYVTTARNLMARPSFEADDDITGWTVETVGGATLQLQTGPEVIHGTHMAKLSWNGDATAFASWDEVIPALPGRTYTFSLDVLRFGDLTVQVVVVIDWYAGATQVGSTYGFAIATLVPLGIGRVFATGQAPPDVDGLKIGLFPQSNSADPANDYIYFDTIRVDEGEDTAYIDGSSPHSQWSGAANKSTSYTARLETDDEWGAYARDAIRRQGGKHRGTPDAIISAAQDTLLGSKSVRLIERVGGNAYALELVTRPSETLDSDATLAAAMTQKPAGMSLIHTLTEGAVIDEGTVSIDTATGQIDTATIDDITT